MKPGDQLLKNSITDWDLYHKVNKTNEKTLDLIRKLSTEGKLRIPEEKIFLIDESIVVRMVRDQFGGLSNSAPGFPVKVNGIEINSAEALFQACKFPYHGFLQEEIIKQNHAADAIRVAESMEFRYAREDWPLVRVAVMYWCLQLKLAQNFSRFGELIKSTGTRQIVINIPTIDSFWSTEKGSMNPAILMGENTLGELLMKLRREHIGNSADFQVVNPPGVKDFLLLGKPIGTIYLS